MAKWHIPPANYSGITHIKDNLYAVVDDKSNSEGFYLFRIDINLKNGKVTNVEFVGGCDGNTKGIAQLVKGMDAQEAADRLAGIRCGYKPTSCPDQLAQALREALARS